MIDEEKPNVDGPTGQRETDQIARKAERRKKALSRPSRSAWYGLGMFGLVGWAVAVPIVAGTALGAWIDSKTDGSSSWTLTGLFAGVALGCLNAWYWVQRESKDD